MIKPRPLIVLDSNSLPPRQAGVDETCRPAVKINDCVKAPGEKPRASRIFPARNQYLVEIRIAVEAARKPGLDQNAHAKAGKFLLERPDRARQQNAIPHGTKANKEDACLGWKTMKEVFSLQLSLR